MAQPRAHPIHAFPAGRTASTYRSYADPQGQEPVSCQPTDESGLIRLAALADQIEIRQPQGSGWVQSDLVDQLMNALRALPLLTGPEVIHPEAALRRLRLIVSDRLARIRIRHSRHVLVGEFQRQMGGVSQRVLVLVLTHRRVTSCDWRLAA